MVHGRLAEPCARDSDQAEPEVLDLMLTSFVIRKEVARDSDLRVWNRVAPAEKPNEELDHRRIRVDEFDTVSILRTFGPEQHAAGCVEQVGLSRALSSRRLKLSSPRQRDDGVGARTVDTTGCDDAAPLAARASDRCRAPTD
jgi:hypothetical protein